jgi:hypothetical protein
MRRATKEWLAMRTRHACLAVTFLGWSAALASAGEELSRVWSDMSISVRERAAAVNRAFTNGTLVSQVVSALGTNYTLCGSSARLSLGPEPGPPNTFWLSYRFGEEEVTIGSSAVFGRDLDPLSCKFTGAGYGGPVAHSTATTNRIWIGPANGSLPEWAKAAAENRIRIGQPDSSANSVTNLLTTAEAVKLVSRLHLRMREKDVTTLLQRGGLKCDMERMGGGFNWLNSCPLADRRSLVLDFRGTGRTGDREGGLLNSAYITSWTGDKVLSITLSNAP